MKISKPVYEKYQKHLSTYLIEGWTQDIHCIKSVEINSEGIVALIDAFEPYLPKEQYYFSTVQAVPLIYQCMILYASYNDFSEKPGEVYLRDLKIECRRMIKKLEDIRLELNLIDKRQLKEWIYYTMNYSFDNAFRGQVKFVLPLVSQD